MPPILSIAGLGKTYGTQRALRDVTVQVPPGMTLGRSLRLKGKGWPRAGGRGDLLLSLSLKQPASYSEQERQLLEQLRAAAGHDRCHHARESNRNCATDHWPSA